MKNKTGVNTSELVYEHLKNKILNRELRCGDRIQEQMLVEELGVSRTPIREAFQKLANEGVVILDRYAEVASFNETQIRQIGELRMGLELMAAKLALYYGSDADFHRMASLAEACEKADREHDLALCISSDAAFHLALAECSRNPILLNLQRKLYSRVELIQANSEPSEESSASLAQYHRQLVEHLRARDQEAVIRCIINHFYDFYGLSGYYPENFFDLFQ